MNLKILAIPVAIEKHRGQIYLKLKQKGLCDEAAWMDDLSTRIANLIYKSPEVTDELWADNLAWTANLLKNDIAFTSKPGFSDLSVDEWIVLSGKIKEKVQLINQEYFSFGLEHDKLLWESILEDFMAAVYRR